MNEVDSAMSHKNVLDTILSQKKTAELFGVSASHLSRRVRERKPVGSEDLSEYAVRDENERIVGFSFPPGYDFPCQEDGADRGPATMEKEEESADAANREQVQVEDSGSGKSSCETPLSSDAMELAATSENEALVRSSGQQPCPHDMFARTKADFLNGRRAWGGLLRIQEGADPVYLTRIDRAEAVTPEWVAVTYGLGAYRFYTRDEEDKTVSFDVTIGREVAPVIGELIGRVHELIDANESLRQQYWERDEKVFDLNRKCRRLKWEYEWERHEWEEKNWQLKCEHKSKLYDLNSKKRAERHKLEEEYETRIRALKNELREAHAELEISLGRQGSTADKVIEGIMKLIARMKEEHPDLVSQILDRLDLDASGQGA